MSDGTAALSTRQAVAHELRQAVMAELERRELTDPYALGAAIELAAIKADGLLRRRRWPIETSMEIIEMLELPIALRVDRPDAGHGAAG